MGRGHCQENYRAAPDVRGRPSGIGLAFGVEFLRVFAVTRRNASHLLRVQPQCGTVSELAERYRDRRPDLADLCLIRMSELAPKHSVITADSNFRIYRRNKRDAIPLICPPN